MPGEAADKGIKRAPILVRPSSPPPRSATTAREPQAPAGIKPPGSRTSRIPTRTRPARRRRLPVPAAARRSRLAIQRAAQAARQAGRQAAGRHDVLIRTHGDATAAV